MKTKRILLSKCTFGHDPFRCSSYLVHAVHRGHLFGPPITLFTNREETGSVLFYFEKGKVSIIPDGPLG
jgi:hypothetical protein